MFALSPVSSLPSATLLDVIGSSGKGLGQLFRPEKVCFSPVSGHVIVADYGNKRVQVCCGSRLARRVVLHEDFMQVDTLVYPWYRYHVMEGPCPLSCVQNFRVFGIFGHH